MSYLPTTALSWTEAGRLKIGDGALQVSVDYSKQSQSLSASILETSIGYLEGPDSATATQSTVLQLGRLKAEASLLDGSVDGLTQSDGAAPAASASIDLSDLTGAAALLVQHHSCDSSTLPLRCHRSMSRRGVSFHIWWSNAHGAWISRGTSSSYVLDLGLVQIDTRVWAMAVLCEADTVIAACKLAADVAAFEATLLGKLGRNGRQPPPATAQVADTVLPLPGTFMFLLWLWGFCMVLV